MIKNYCRIALRNLRRNKVLAMINIGGLSVGIATGIIILLVITDELTYDRFHDNLDEIYQIKKNEVDNGNIATSQVLPVPLADALANEIPEFKYVVRTSQSAELLVGNEDKSFFEKSIYADPDFFKMMTFPAIEGDPATALQQPGSIVLTQSASKRMFGDESAMGKLISLNNKITAKVAAVIADVPENSSIHFQMVLPFSLFKQQNDWVSRWDYHAITTWVQLHSDASLSQVNAKLKNIYSRLTSSKDISLFAYPLADLRLHNRFVNGKPSGGTINTIVTLGIIAAFVLLVACINFMNLATAQSEQRIKEVGVRKVMGATRWKVMLQYLSEAVVVALLALVLGIFLAYLALPSFMQFTTKHFVPAFDNWCIWGLLLSLGLITGFVAGSYPALYLSAFNPISVLQKKFGKGGRKGMLRKVLVTFQFVIAIVFIIATIVIHKQITFLQNRPIGYEAQNLVDIQVHGELAKKIDVFQNEAAQLPGVESVAAGTDKLVDFSGAFNGLDWPGKTADQDFYITATNVSDNWVTTTGLRLLEGRDFDAVDGADSLSCIINETALKRMNLTMPVVGTKLGDHTIVGVVEDFVFNNPTEATKPLIAFFGKGSMNHIFVRIQNDENWKQTLNQLETITKRLDPHFPFTFSFAKEDHQQKFEEIKSVLTMASVFGTLTIFISCIGLFGLSAFLAERRSKEMSIRKVLGASVGGIWFALAKDFLKPIIWAFVIAAPLAGWVAHKLLGRMDYHIELSWWMFVLAGTICILIALVTISYNGIRAAFINPAMKLRNE